jgi:hypothetical protein
MLVVPGRLESITAQFQKVVSSKSSPPNSYRGRTVTKHPLWPRGVSPDVTNILESKEVGNDWKKDWRDGDSNLGILARSPDF